MTMSRRPAKRAAFLLGCVFLLAASLPASAESRKPYKHLSVQALEVPDQTDFPPDFAEALRHNIARHLQDTKRFDTVSFVDKGQQPSSDSDLILSGKIVRFDKGSRMGRYLLPGAGTTRIRAIMTFVDPATSKTVLEREVSGKVVIGVFGGDSKGATNGLAKDLAKAVKKELP